jgi:hypothetical protein
MERFHPESWRMADILSAGFGQAATLGRVQPQPAQAGHTPCPSPTLGCPSRSRPPAQAQPAPAQVQHPAAQAQSAALHPQPRRSTINNQPPTPDPRPPTPDPRPPTPDPRPPTLTLCPPYGGQRKTSHRAPFGFIIPGFIFKPHPIPNPNRPHRLPPSSLKQTLSLQIHRP